MLFVVVPVMVIVINIIEIGMLVRKRKNLKNYERLLLSLSVADLLVGITFLVYLLPWLEKSYDKPISAVFWYSITTSLFHVVLLTLDRAVAVLFPLKHRAWITTKFTKISIAVSWMSSLLSVTSFLFNRSKRITKTIIGYMTILTIVILVIVYSVITHKVMIKRYKQGPQYRFGPSTRRDLNLVAISIFITVTFAGFTIPFSIKSVTNNKESFQQMLMIVLNSLTNPLIYFFWMFLQRYVKSKVVSKRVAEAGTCNNKIKS